MVRDGHGSHLTGRDGTEVVAASGEGMEAVMQYRRTMPDVALLGAVMPDRNGIDAAAWIKAKCPSVRVAVMSVSSSIDDVYRALQTGACGYIAIARIAYSAKRHHRVLGTADR